MKWKANRPSMLVVHCSATRPSQDIGAEDIDRWHRERGWWMIGYHYVIRRDGTVEPGRPEHAAGAHAKGYNKGSLGICMVGGINADNGAAEDNFTSEQYASLEGLLVRLSKKYKVEAIVGHRDLPGVRKACPSFNVPDWLATKPSILKALS